MKKIMLEIVKYFIVFHALLLFLFSILLCSTLIPRKAVQTKFEETAEYLCENHTIFRVVPYISSSQLDRYADVILLSIAYHIDEGNHFNSIMWANYYGTSSQLANEDFLKSVEENLPADHQYLRYWHGAVPFLRILHLGMNIRDIYILNSCLMIGLFIWLIILLGRNGYFNEAVSLIISIIMVSSWFVPLCLEYTWCFFIMLIVSIIGSIQALQKNYFPLLFLISGILTAYLDFLSTETITLLIPLLIVLQIMEKQEISKQRKYFFAFKSCCAWLLGYIGMWGSKWIIASVILRQNVMTYIVPHIDERIGGGFYNLSIFEYIVQAIMRNIKCLLPYDYGLIGSVIYFLLIIFLIVLPVISGKICLKKRVNTGQIVLYLFIGIVPFIRFAILHNHSYIHCLFTFRALLTTVMSICLIAIQLVEEKTKPERC